MKRGLTASLTAAALLLVCGARAQEENPLSRDEVGSIKKKLVNVLDALGQPPAGYSIEHESFNLPTEAYKAQKTNLYNLIGAGADRKYGTQKKTEAANEDMQKEYQKKLLEAQAKGDYQELGRLSQEMQKKMSEAQLKAVEGNKEPIDVRISFNSNPGATIDPDAVLFERAGVIALKSADDNSKGKTRVHIYFDPVSLKDTKQLSRVNMKQPEDGVARRTTVLNATIELYGPAADVEALAKKIDTKKVLAQIDTAK